MRYALLFAALAVVAIAAAQLGSRDEPPPAVDQAPVATKSSPERPEHPPGRDTPPPVLDEPVAPVADEETRAEISEKVRGAAQPGMTAFRAFSDLYVDANLDLARLQAEREKITLAEVRELTHFGNLVLATQRVPDVEEILGRSLSGEQRTALAELMASANTGFKREMRDLVKAGASQNDRWKLIQETEATYLASFYETTGMTEALLDDLLAGNMMLPGAPINTPVPDKVPPRDPDDPVDRDPEPVRPR